MKGKFAERKIHWVGMIGGLGIWALSLAGPARALPPPDPRFPEAGIGFFEDYLQARAAGLGIRSFVPQEVIQPEGNWNILVILIEFADMDFAGGEEEATEYFQDLFFGVEGEGSFAGKSFAGYFEEMAAGVFYFNRPGEAGSASLIYPCAATGTHDYYGTGGSSRAKLGAELAREAVTLVADAGYELTNFDNNGDGVAESIVIIHPGYGAEQTDESDNNIWSHSTEIPDLIIDGVAIHYAMGPELDKDRERKSGIGIFAHEYTHVLGIPDLYDPDTTRSRGLGFYDLMAYGLYTDPPVYLSAWPRYRLGWLKVQETEINLCPAELNPVGSTGEGYIFYPNGIEGDEYFLATFRTTEGNDLLLPGRGLLIWHVDESKWSGETYGTPNNSPWYPGSELDPCTDHFLVALEQADGNWDLEDPQCVPEADWVPCFWDENDYWNTGKSFNENSTPGSRTYCNDSSGINLENIKIDSADPGRIRWAAIIDLENDQFQAPAVLSLPGEEAFSGELYQYQLEAYGTEPMEFSLLDYPSGMTVDAETGWVYWTPDDTQIGTNWASIEVDNCRGTEQQNWDVEVQYRWPEEDEGGVDGGCGCNSLQGLGFFPLGMLIFWGQRRWRKSR